MRLTSAAILNGGDIELFGMTIDVGTADSQGDISTASYELWIDYALSKNPSTIIMIGVPWVDYPSDYDTPSYTATMRDAYPTLQTGVYAALRAKYPSTTIIENPYGLGVVEARLLFEAGGLPDVTSLFGGCANDETGQSSCGAKLFNDYKGHGAEHFVQRAANQSVARGSNALDQSSRMVFSQTAGDYKGHAPEHYASPVRVANQSLSRGTEALANDGSMHLTRSSDDYKAFH